MILDVDLMLDNMVKEQLKVSHLEKKITSKVIPVKKMNKKLKDAIKKEYDEKLLKDADYVILCMENEVVVDKPEEEKEEEPKEETSTDTKEDTEKEEPTEETTDDTEETSDEDTIGDEESEETSDEEEPSFGVGDEKDAGDTEEEPKEEPKEEPEEEPTEDNEEDKEKEKDKEELNENIKIQDLTKSMLTSVKVSTPKSSTPKTSTPKQSTKKCDCKGECKKKECKCKKVEEAETEATGEELRSKVHNALNNVFKTESDENNKIEMYDIKGTKESCYFAKITIKTREVQTEEK